MINIFSLHTRVGYVVLLFTFSNISFSQDILWEKSLGGQKADYLMDALPTPDYGFILAGSSLSNRSGNKMEDNVGDLDYWVWKMNEEGELDWQKNFGGAGVDFLQSVKLTRDGGFILAGNSNSQKGFDKLEESKGQDDFWVIKLNAGGGQQWQKTIGGFGQEKLQSVCQTKDGGYILGGSSASDKSGDKSENSYGNLDFWIVKLDKDGSIEWQKTIGGVFLDELRNIEQTTDGGYIVGGYSNSPNSGNKNENNSGIGDYWIIKLNKKGEIDWQKVFGGEQDDQLYVIHQTHDGGYLLGGNSNSGSNNSKTKGNGKGSDFWIVKLDSDGNNLWQETYDFGKSDILTSMIENEDNTILIGGFAKSETEQSYKKDDEGINDYIALKISETGEVLWQKSVGSDGDDILKKLIETRDGGYLLAGTSNPIANKNILKKDNSGNSSSTISIGAVDKINDQLANAVSTVNDRLKQATQEVNDIYNKQAEKIKKEVNDALNPNQNSRFKTTFNTSSNPFQSPMSLGNGGDGIDPLSGLMNGIGSPTDSPASKNKATNYGNSDFWVIKLKDKSKKAKPKKMIEAFPNPTSGYTNIIIGYDFEKGSATLVDLAGHVLQQFEVTSRTVPVDMKDYPTGIYVLNIKTDKRTEGIKILKSGK